MIDLNSDSFSFSSEKQVEAYARFFLETTSDDIVSEFSTQEEVDNFLIKRERMIKTQLDFLKDLTFTSPHKNKIEANYYKITKAIHTNPLGSEGALKKSSRFNYKKIELLRNRTIYFGQDKLCCETELFHIDAQKQQLNTLLDDYEANEGDIMSAKYNIHEYKISLDNVLILTTPSCWKALGISSSVLKNEWFDLNDEYEVPTASQILGSIARIKGLNGILYPSVRSQAKHNLVVFEENSGELKFEQLSGQEYTPSPDFAEEILMSPLQN